METIYKEHTFENFTWIDICNPDKKNLDEIAKKHNLDYFQIKNSIQTGYLPKFEKQETYNFLILRAYTAKLHEKVTNINDLSNKIAFFYSRDKIITIHRTGFSFLESVSQKYTTVEELLLYFMHKMCETFVIPAKVLGDKNDKIEKTIFLNDHSKISLKDLYFQKTETRITKKLLQITQNVLNQIEVSPKSKTSLQNIKDKLLDLILMHDEVLENSNNLFNTYMSFNTQKSNDVMKLLTIFSAFFLPLTFLAGIYGMNFKNMPELEFKMGYYATLGVMVGISVCIYIWFRAKKII